VRVAIGEQRPKAAPKGQLRERQWAALARLYAASDLGELSEEMMYGRGGFDWMRTLLRLHDYKLQPLMEEYRIPYHDKGGALWLHQRILQFPNYGKNLGV
jgi:hypothetical protein